MKSLRIALSIILIAIIVCGCTNPNGPKMYTFGGTWETDGNSVTFLSVRITDSYTAKDGTEYNPAEGKTFMLIECSASFAEGWYFSDDTYLNMTNGATEPRYKLFCDPIPADGDCYVLLFSMFKDTFTGKPEDYRVELVIEQTETVRRTQAFLLMR